MKITMKYIDRREERKEKNSNHGGGKRAPYKARTGAGLA